MPSGAGGRGESSEDVAFCREEEELLKRKGVASVEG